MATFDKRLWLIPSIISFASSYIATWQHSALCAVLAFGTACICAKIAGNDGRQFDSQGNKS